MKQRTSGDVGVWSLIATMAIACTGGKSGSSGQADTASMSVDAASGDAESENGDASTGDDAESDGAAEGRDTAGDGGDGVVVDLRVDSNRDGIVDVTGSADDADETTWDGVRGAVFLANLDDDQSVCPTDVDDVDLPNCNDAADEAINGADDLEDMAQLVLMRSDGTPVDATVSLQSIPPGKVRVFRQVAKNNPIGWAPWPADGVSGADVREGVALRVEGLDIVRSRDEWDGFVTIRVTVTSNGNVLGTDEVRMRVAPVLTYHHLLDAEVVYASQISGKDSKDFRDDLAVALSASGMPPLLGAPYGDQWNQDYFETAFMSMPGPGGSQHVIRVHYRSANVYESSGRNPLRPAGRFAFDLRGPNSAAIQHYDLGHDGNMDSLNSFGNTETIPPYTKDGTSYPLGRLFRGSVDFFYPDPKFSELLESQAVQPPVYVDTSWLLVGHVDETITFLPTKKAARGWTMGVNDARLAKTMLEKIEADGLGDTPVFQGRYWEAFKKADTTVSKILNNEAVLTSSAKSAADTDAQVAILLEATGVTEDELVPFPFLHEEQYGYSVAYQPGTVNGILISPNSFAMPKPYGPILDGKDVFEAHAIETLGAHDIASHFVENWNLYHRLLGEVHCGSNVTRAIPEVLWWETGR